MHKHSVGAWILFACISALQPCAAGDKKGFDWLFASEGPPKGWSVRSSNDLAKKVVSADTEWTVKEGVLLSPKRRETWLVSDREYRDFILEFEIKLGELGRSGVALRAPPKGDPACDGLELQIVDFRYNTKATDEELTGALCRAIAPTKRVYRPTKWNALRVELKGARLKVTLNGTAVQELDLNKLDRPLKRRDGSSASPLKNRPRSGHIGFQHLSKDDVPVQIRGARIKELK